MSFLYLSDYGLVMPVLQCLETLVSCICFCFRVALSELPVALSWPEWQSPVLNYWFYLIVIRILMFSVSSLINYVSPGNCLFTCNFSHFLAKSCSKYLVFISIYTTSIHGLLSFSWSISSEVVKFICLSNEFWKNNLFCYFDLLYWMFIILCVCACVLLFLLFASFYSLWVSFSVFQDHV